MPSASTYGKFISALCGARKADDGCMIQGEIKKINKVASKNYYFNTIHVLFYLSFFFNTCIILFIFFLESMVGSFWIYFIFSLNVSRNRT